MSRWSVETHTFVTAWGEFSPSLEDVGYADISPTFWRGSRSQSLSGWRGQEKDEALQASLSKSKILDQQSNVVVVGEVLL